MASSNRTVKGSGEAPVAAPVDPVPGADIDTEERVRVAAYFIYENNGRRQGHALEDWLAAQGQLGMGSSGNSAPADAQPEG